MNVREYVLESANRGRIIPRMSNNQQVRVDIDSFIFQISQPVLTLHYRYAVNKPLPELWIWWGRPPESLCSRPDRRMGSSCLGLHPRHFLRAAWRRRVRGPTRHALGIQRYVPPVGAERRYSACGCSLHGIYGRSGGHGHARSPPVVLSRCVCMHVALLMNLCMCACMEHNLWIWVCVHAWGVIRGSERLCMHGALLLVRNI